MLRSVLLCLFCLIPPTQAASPYAASRAIPGVTFHLDSYRAGGFGGDIWPVTQTAGGALITAWGDAALGKCSTKVPWGVARVEGSPSTNLSVLSCGSRGKIKSLVAVGGTLYAQQVYRLRTTTGGQGIMRSTNGGATWTQPTAGKRRFMFVQVGYGNTGPGGWVYAIETIGNSVHLRRVAPSQVQSEAAYEFFSGTAARPAWSRLSSASRAIFTDPAGILHPTLAWNPGRQRFLLAGAHGGYNPSSFPRLGIFDSPNLWGPWTTVHYSNRFMGATGGLFLSFNFPPHWSSGNVSWATFSCHNNTQPGSCGKYHDQFSIVRATFH